MGVSDYGCDHGSGYRVARGGTRECLRCGASFISFSRERSSGEDESEAGERPVERREPPVQWNRTIHPWRTYPRD